MLWLAVGVGLLTLVLYWPVRHLQLTYWDDVGYLKIAQTNRLTWAGIKYAFTSTYIYYQPLTWRHTERIAAQTATTAARQVKQFDQSFLAKRFAIRLHSTRCKCGAASRRC